jgi:putative ABC transport system permease protein
VRLAARDIARRRARTGPLVAAILAVASLAVLGSTITKAEEARSGDTNDFGIGRDQALLSRSDGQATVPAQLRERVRALLPEAVEAEMGFHEERRADGTRAAVVVRDRSGGAHVPGPAGSVRSRLAIGGPELLRALGAAAARPAFDRGEVVALSPGLVEHGQVAIEVPGGRGQPRSLALAASEARLDRPQRQLFVPLVISTQQAARLGLTPTVVDVVFRTPGALTAAQRHALQAQALASDRGASPQAAAEITVAGDARPPDISGTLATLLALAAALTLAVVAIGLALSAAEDRADDSLLVALGADPAARRRLRATQAALLVGIGGLLAVPAGLVPAAVIIAEGSDLEGDPLQFTMPWPAVTVVLLALPAAAAAGAWLLTRPARWAPPATWGD